MKKSVKKSVKKPTIIDTLSESDIRSISIYYEKAMALIKAVWKLTRKQREELLKRHILGEDRRWLCDHRLSQDISETLKSDNLYHIWETDMREHFGEELINKINRAHNKNIT